MKHMILFTIVIWVVALSVSESLAQRPQQQTKLTQLSAQEAFRILKELNGQKKLAPAFFDEPAEYTGLRPENCFGLILPNGLRLVGESSGHGYGLDYQSAGKWFVLIGFLYSETGFSVSNQPFTKRAYSIFAASDVVGISTGKLGDLKTVPISSKIDESLLKGGQGGSSLKRSRFSLTQEGGDILLNVEGNKIVVKIE